MTRLCLILAAGLLTAVLSPSAAGSAPRPQVSISPATQELTIGQDQAEAAFTLKIANQAGESQRFRLSVADFGTLDESGGVVFLGPSQALNRKYGLAGWVTLDHSEVAIAPGESQKVQVVVRNINNLAPGGHYGAVLVNQIGSEASSNPTVVQLRPILSSLMFVTKQGGENYDLRLQSVRTRANWLQLPSRVELRFHNTGNVHVIPRGIVRIKDPWGREVERGIINQDSSIILPETFRVYGISLHRMGLAQWPGRYRVQVEYRYDGYDKFAVKTQDIYFLNLPALVLILLVGLGLIGWFVRRRRSHPRKR